MKGGELMSSNILDYSLYVSGNFKEHYAKKQVKKNEIIIDQNYAIFYHSHFINYLFYHLPT